MPVAFYLGKAKNPIASIIRMLDHLPTNSAAEPKESISILLEVDSMKPTSILSFGFVDQNLFALASSNLLFG